MKTNKWNSFLFCGLCFACLFFLTSCFDFNMQSATKPTDDPSKKDIAGKYKNENPLQWGEKVAG
ncbi:MAG: hypothetical protein M1543_00240, partial [Firmicutes bacterium]|nr:hypothetical protein [Bacillota bacterium]